MKVDTSQVLAISRVGLEPILAFLQKHNLPLSGIGALTCTLILHKIVQTAFRQIWGRGPIGALKLGYKAVKRDLYGVFLSLPIIRDKVDAELKDVLIRTENKVLKGADSVERYRSLPENGWADDIVLDRLREHADMDHVRWEDGKVSGAVYHGGQQLIDLQVKAYGEFTVANPIHPDVFPAVRKMEAEIVSMVLGLFHAPGDAAGATTCGGTESILAACLSARERGRIEKGITHPEMIIPSTAHPAFRKAAHYFGIKIHEVDCPAPSYQVDTATVGRLMNSNTVLIVGSAPNYPHGIIDDIPALSRLAASRDTLLHVDCCLGSFMIAFLEQAGLGSVQFDFRLPGVTSISCDTHKYGFAPKGTSVVMYRTKQLRSYQYFISADWSGGVYPSQGLMGSRPGALLAGCWASLVNQGADGYVDACRQIVGCTRRIEQFLRTDPAVSKHLSVIGNPRVSVVAFESATLNVWNIADAMTARGWHLNALQNPPGIHIAVTLPVVNAVEDLFTDLSVVVEAEAGKVARGEVDAKPGDSFSLYGVAGSLPNKGIMVRIIRGYLDSLYIA